MADKTCGNCIQCEKYISSTDGKEKRRRSMLEFSTKNPTTEVVDGWLVRNDGPYGQNRLYCPHCHRHSGLHRPRPFCPWCGKQVTGDLDKYYSGRMPADDDYCSCGEKREER